jgi:hypothetical protein
MRPEEVFDLLRNQPFVPFRVFLTDGSIFDIKSRSGDAYPLSPACGCVAARGRSITISPDSLRLDSHYTFGISSFDRRLTLPNCRKCIMVTRQEIERLLKAKPFVPFRVYMKDGRHYDVVRYPGQTLVTDWGLHIGVDPESEDIWIYDRVVDCAYSHMDRVEPLEAART